MSDTDALQDKQHKLRESLDELLRVRPELAADTAMVNEIHEIAQEY